MRADESCLSIAYNGILCDEIPHRKSRHHGAVLTRGGQVYYRKSCDRCWECIQTPAVFYFYDKHRCATYKVDKCIITEAEPQGRILDCVDRTIYEIKHGKWVQVCRLSSKRRKTLVKTTVLPLDATSYTFRYLGCDPCVDRFSEIPCAFVRFADGIATVNYNFTLVPVGESIALIYHTKLDCEKVTVIRLFVRLDTGATTIRFSANGGTLAARPSTATVTGTVPAPLVQAGNSYDITGWTSIYDRPGSALDAALGTFTVKTPGDYEFTVDISYNYGGRVRSVWMTDGTVTVGFPGEFVTVTSIVTRTTVPYFALLKNNTIVAVAPVVAQRRYPTQEDFADLDNNTLTAYYVDLNTLQSLQDRLPIRTTEVIDIAEVGKVSINAAVPANAGDVFRVVYVVDTITIESYARGIRANGNELDYTTASEDFTPIPAILGIGSSFSAEYLGRA